VSSYAGLYVGGAEVFSWRNLIDPTFFFPYTKDDVRHVPIDADEVWDENIKESIYVMSSASVLADRLDALGIWKSGGYPNSIGASANGWRASNTLAMAECSGPTNLRPRLNCSRHSRFRTGLLSSCSAKRKSDCDKSTRGQQVHQSVVTPTMVGVSRVQVYR
jgi:hypothetical protein